MADLILSCLLNTKPSVYLDIQISRIFTFAVTSQNCVGPSAMGYHIILLPRTTCRRVLDSTGRRCLCVKRLTFHSFLARVRPHILFVQYIKKILKKIKSLRHRVFPGGPPSKYYPGPTMLNFRDQTRTGVFIVVWS